MSKSFTFRSGGRMTAGASILLLAGCTWYGEDFIRLPGAMGDLEIIEPLRPESLARQTPPPETRLPSEPGGRPPPAELSLSIEECRAAALRNNLSIEAALIDPVVAAERITQEEARFEAVFKAEASYGSADTPTSTTLEGSRVRRFNFKTGVEMPLRTGGVLRFDLADRRTRTNNAFSTLNPAYDTDLTASISQPLLRNAGRRIATHGIRLAVYARQISRAATRLEIIRVLAAVDRVYWRLYAARRVLEVRRQDYGLAQAQLATARRFVESGERSQVEVIRAEAALAGRLEGIITAENALRNRQRELKRALNRRDLPLGSPTVLVPATEPNPVHYELNPRELVGLATGHRMELLELELQLAQDDSTIEYLDNQLLPLVTLDYVYNVNGLGEARWDAYDLLDNRRFTDHYAGVRLLVPLGNAAAESRLRQALLERAQRLATKADRESLIQQEVLSARDNLEATWQRILANRQRVLLARRLLDTERRQFELGLNTSNDVLEAQTSLADAQSAEIQALAEYQIALVDLAYATGTVLGAARIQWQEVPAP